MTDRQRRRVLLLGFDDALLWQLTKSLALVEDRIEVHCAGDFSVAREICGEVSFDVIVVDGWEKSWEAGYSLGWDAVSELNPKRWVILVESVLMEGLLDKRITSSAVFIEKPFNPKDFPSFLFRVLEGNHEGEIEPFVPADRETVEDEAERDGEEDLATLAGESYRPPAGEQDHEPGSPASTEIRSGPDEREEVAAPVEETTPSKEAVEESGFYDHLNQGFACLKSKDWQGARRHWEKALEIRPQDKRVLANLRRIEKLNP